MRILRDDLPATIPQDWCTLLHYGAHYTENVVTQRPTLLPCRPQEEIRDVCRNRKEHGHWLALHDFPCLVEKGDGEGALHSRAPSGYMPSGSPVPSTKEQKGLTVFSTICLASSCQSFASGFPAAISAACSLGPPHACLM